MLIYTWHKVEEEWVGAQGVRKGDRKKSLHSTYEGFTHDPYTSYYSPPLNAAT